MTVQLNSFLLMDGNAKEAIDFYKESLDANLLFCQTFGDEPDDPKSPLPENLKDLVAFYFSLLRLVRYGGLAVNGTGTYGMLAIAYRPWLSVYLIPKRHIRK
ncbi:hypothetical protein [Bacillus sp. AFS088145]|uniref:hypothetical protein n=1 Tax=Bacillus sp. AFS088145 TaxID=2033514 RepID=UPI000BF5EDEC|nr:hypothetical protein [Bacillus sp. AFS088145]PFH84909.1 hypothetical protein COI44_16560 [Bacillus sp. AFS088145]